MGGKTNKAVDFMITCQRRIQFCAGHRVMGHENKCANIHGHNYTAWIYATAPDLDKLGRVIDFSVIKKEVGEWIETNWDHTFLVYALDQSVIDALVMVNGKTKVPFIMNENPTAENMARYLCGKANDLLRPYGIDVIRVDIEETPNCHATYLQ